MNSDLIWIDERLRGVFTDLCHMLSISSTKSVFKSYPRFMEKSPFVNCCCFVKFVMRLFCTCLLHVNAMQLWVGIQGSYIPDQFPTANTKTTILSLNYANNSSFYSLVALLKQFFCYRIIKTTNTKTVNNKGHLWSTLQN